MKSPNKEHTTAEIIKVQAQAVAKTGRANLFDTRAVFEIATEMGFDELCGLIFAHTDLYGTLILTGELPTDYENPIV